MLKHKQRREDASFKVYVVVGIIAALYFSFALFEAIRMNKNTYDFMTQMMNILTVSYIIIPLFLFVLVNGISRNSLNNLRLLRFMKKSSYYHMIIKSIVMMVSQFIGLLSIIHLALSVFSLSFRNEWSVYAVEYYKNNHFVLDNYTPAFYLLYSLLLLWLFLLFIGIVYFILLLITKNTSIALIIIIILVVLNIAISISHIGILTNVFFTKHLDIAQYIYNHKSSDFSLLYNIYLYWGILLIASYFLGYVLIHRVDLDEGKGSVK